MDLQVRLTALHWGSTWNRQFQNGVTNLRVTRDRWGWFVVSWVTARGRNESRRYRTEQEAIRRASKASGVPVKALRIRDYGAA